MKKIIFVLLLLPTILSAQTKLYKAGGFVYVEDSKITAFNPAQSSYYLLESKCVIRDNVNEIHKNLIYGEITDSSGVYYMTKQEVSLFLQKNLNQAVNLLINDEIVDSDNPLAIVDYDPNSRVSLNTVFGDKVTGIRKTDIAAQFQYGVEDGTSDTELENGGTVSINESMLVISSGINPDARARIQSTETVRYVPGQQLYCFFTVVFDTARENSYQRVGIFDDKNGFFIGYEDTVLVFGRRRDSVQYIQSIDIDEFKASAGFDYNPILGNVYSISYGYLGFAPVSLEVMKPNGSWATLAKIEYPNTSTVTHTTQTFLPIRGEVGNTGNTKDITIKSGSLAAGIVDGGNTNVAGRSFSWANDETFVFSDSVTLVTFRNKETFSSIENRVPARLLFISAANASNKILKWRILKNPTLEASPVPVWNDINTNNSTLEYSLNAVANYSLSKDLYLAWNTGVSEQFFIEVEKYLLDMPPGGSASFVIYSGATNAEADISIRWSELF